MWSIDEMFQGSAEDYLLRNKSKHMLSLSTINEGSFSREPPTNPSKLNHDESDEDVVSHKPKYK